MKVFFKGNALYTKLKVSSTISDWTREYDSLVDTGAFNTTIPRDEIIPQTENDVQNLLYLGSHHATGIGFNGYLDTFEANILVGEEDEYKETMIIAGPNRQFLLGREIISQYKWEIDWKIQKVIAILNQ